MPALVNTSALVISIIALFFTPTTLADITKMSSSGLCHPPQSRWYDRTENYEAFESLEACLGAGGALPTGISRTIVAAAHEKFHRKQPYDRSEFGHGWDDADKDCKDSRAEALIATSSTKVQFSGNQRCRVITGRWISPYTNRVIQNAGDIDIDHVVPLAWAWERGANTWSKEQRERFANDPVNLLPVEASLNRSTITI